MTKFFSPSKLAFYDENIHLPRLLPEEQSQAEMRSRKRPKMVPNPACTIPDDAVPISDNEWSDLLEKLNHDGKVLEAVGKKPRAVTPAVVLEDVIVSNRMKRDRLLSASDWTQLSDSPLDEALRVSWQTYRQILRDLDMENPQWPTMPEAGE